MLCVPKKYLRIKKKQSPVNYFRGLLLYCYRRRSAIITTTGIVTTERTVDSANISEE